jgi:hypothetical protein
MLCFSELYITELFYLYPLNEDRDIENIFDAVNQINVCQRKIQEKCYCYYVFFYAYYHFLFMLNSNTLG